MKLNRRNKLAAALLLFAVGSSFEISAQRKSGRQTSTRPRPASMAASIPPRTFGGRLIGNRIELRRTDDKVKLDFVVTGARVADGELQLEGSLKRPGAAFQLSDGVMTQASVIGTMARARQVWNWNRDEEPGRLKKQATSAGATPTSPPQGGSQGTVPESGVRRNPEQTGNVGQLAQATQSTSRNTPTPTSPEGRASVSNAALNEQTQSLYTPADAGSGCDMIYLKMEIASAADISKSPANPAQVAVVLAPRDNAAGEQINKALCRIVRSLKKGEAADTHISELNSLLATK